VIRENTQQCLYLQQGRPRAFGSSEEMISLYIKDCLQKKALAMAARPVDRVSSGMRKMEIVDVKFLSCDGACVEGLASGEEFHAVIRYRANAAVDAPFFSLNFYNDSDWYMRPTAFMRAFIFLRSHPVKGRFICVCRGWTFLRKRIMFLLLPVKEQSAVLWTHSISRTRLSLAAPKNARGALKLPTQWKLEV